MRACRCMIVYKIPKNPHRPFIFRDLNCKTLEQKNPNLQDSQKTHQIKQHTKPINSLTSLTINYIIQKHNTKKKKKPCLFLTKITEKAIPTGEKHQKFQNLHFPSTNSNKKKIVPESSHN